MASKVAPLFDNADLTRLADGILRLSKERKVAVYERFVVIRGHYERDREKLRTELVNTLEVAIARGEKLGYEDDDYRKRYTELTGEDYDDGN